MIQRCAPAVTRVPQYLAFPHDANAGFQYSADPPNAPAPATPQRPMTYLVAYVAVLVVFGIIDAGWLNTMGKLLYRPALGDILLDDLRIAPAIVFYLAYPVGVVAFAVMPGLRADSLLFAFLSALLFGAIAYGTYDLTNYATLRNWTLQITAIDICYGALASGIAATVAMLVARAFAQ
jgi:uncharacterized membrane protein